jgi:hypothetical protein
LKAALAYTVTGQDLISFDTAAGQRCLIRGW